MYNNLRVLVVVPARGGSKGVKHKNIHPLNGKPLITYTADLIQGMTFVDRAVVSTDDQSIADVAKASGLDAPFVRPDSIAGDRIGDADVLRHALIEMERLDQVQYDLIVMLQPTCPLRRSSHVESAIKTLVEEGRDAVWTVNPTDLKYHPLKQMAIDDHGTLQLFDPAGENIIARQQLSPTYTRNGACYAFSRECIHDQKTILGANNGAVVLHEQLVSIDTLEDFDIVANVMTAQNELSRGRN